MYQHELKKQENEIFRIKKQMTKILDEKTTFSNSYMEVKLSTDMKRVAKICDQYRAKGDIEFIEMLKNGFDSTYNVYVEENSKLRNCLMALQNDLRDLVESKTKLIKDTKSKIKDELLKEVNMKLYRLKIIQPLAFKLSLADNIKDIHAVFKENIDRVSKFIDAFINPEKLFNFIDKLNEDPRVRKEMIKIRSLDELHECIVKAITNKGIDLSYKMGLVPEERITARWNTEFEAESGEDEGIYTNNTTTKARSENIHNEPVEDFIKPEYSLKKKQVQIDRKKWENLITSEKSNTFFFDSDGDDDQQN